MQLSTLAAAILLQSAAPAVSGGEIVAEDSACGASGAEDIVVCGRTARGAEYRLPPQDEGFDPWGDVESVSRERHRLLGHLPGGIGSCSTVGPGGWTGCDIQVIKRAEQQGKRVGIGNARASVGLQVGRRHVGIGDD